MLRLKIKSLSENHLYGDLQKIEKWGLRMIFNRILSVSACFSVFVSVSFSLNSHIILFFLSVKNKGLTSRELEIHVESLRKNDKLS